MATLEPGIPTFGGSAVEDPMELTSDIDRRANTDDDVDIDIDFGGRTPENHDDEFMMEDGEESTERYPGFDNRGAEFGRDDEMADQVDTDQVFTDTITDDFETNIDIFTNDENLGDLGDMEEPMAHNSNTISSNLQSSFHSGIESLGSGNDPKFPLFPSTETNFFANANDLSQDTPYDFDTVDQHNEDGELGGIFYQEDDLDHSEFVDPLSHGNTNSVGVPKGLEDAKSSDQATSDIHANAGVEFGDDDFGETGSIPDPTQGQEEVLQKLDSHNKKLDAPTASEEQERYEPDIVHDEIHVEAHLREKNDSVNDSNLQGGTNETFDELNDSFNESSELSQDDDVPQSHPVVVTYQDNRISLFPPNEKDEEHSQTYFLQDESLIDKDLGTLLQSCRHVLAESIGDQDELEINITSLGLEVCESTIDCKSRSLAEIIDIYLRLQRNDGIDHAEPIHMNLTIRPKFSHRFAYLETAIAEGKGLSEIIYLDKAEHFDNNHHQREDQRVGGEDNTLEKSGDTQAAETKDEIDEVWGDEDKSNSKVEPDVTSSELKQNLQEDRLTIGSSPKKNEQLLRNIQGPYRSEEITLESLTNNNPGEPTKHKSQSPKLESIDLGTKVVKKGPAQKRAGEIGIGEFDDEVEIDFEDHEKVLPESSTVSSTLRGDGSEHDKEVRTDGKVSSRHTGHQGHHGGNNETEVHTNEAADNGIIDASNLLDDGLNDLSQEELDLTGDFHVDFDNQDFGLNLGTTNGEISTADNHVTDEFELATEPPKAVDDPAAVDNDEITYEDSDEEDGDAAQDYPSSATGPTEDLTQGSIASYSSLKRLRPDDDDEEEDNIANAQETKRVRSDLKP